MQSHTCARAVAPGLLPPDHGWRWQLTPCHHRLRGRPPARPHRRQGERVRARTHPRTSWRRSSGEPPPHVRPPPHGGGARRRWGVPAAATAALLSCVTAPALRARRGRRRRGRARSGRGVRPSRTPTAPPCNRPRHLYPHATHGKQKKKKTAPRSNNTNGAAGYAGRERPAGRRTPPAVPTRVEYDRSGSRQHHHAGTSW